MRRLIATCAIVLLVSMNINSYLQIKAIENLTNVVSESQQDHTRTISLDELTVNQQQQVMDIVTYNEPEEVIVPVYYEKEASGAIFYTFGDMIMDKYAFGIMIHEEQGIYTYYDYDDNRIECKSLAELQEVVMCHIDQAYPNARFVMR